MKNTIFSTIKLSSEQIKQIPVGRPNQNYTTRLVGGVSVNEEDSVYLVIALEE